MDNTEEIIESLEEMTVNYKHLFKKYDDMFSTIEKSKKDFQTMKKAYAKLLSEDSSSTLEDVEKEHKKIYFENHFKLEDSNSKSEISEKDPVKLSKITTKLSNTLEEMTVNYENLKKEVEENNKKMKKTFHISENEYNINEQLGKYDLYPNNVVWNDYGESWRRYMKYYEDIEDIRKKHEIEKIYVICNKIHCQGNPSLTYCSYTWNLLVKEFPFIEKRRHYFNKYDENYPNILFLSNGNYCNGAMKSREFFSNLLYNHENKYNYIMDYYEP